MKGKVFLAVVVLMCLALVAQSAIAQPQGRGSREGRGPGQGGQGRGGMMGRGGGMMGGRGMFEGLDLTEEQQAKIAKIREEIMEKARNADSSEARREIFGQMREKLQSILTPEQREKTNPDTSLTVFWQQKSRRPGFRAVDWALSCSQLRIPVCTRVSNLTTVKTLLAGTYYPQGYKLHSC